MWEGVVLVVPLQVLDTEALTVPLEDRLEFAEGVFVGVTDLLIDGVGVPVPLTVGVWVPDFVDVGVWVNLVVRVWLPVDVFEGEVGVAVRVVEGVIEGVIEAVAGGCSSKPAWQHWEAPAIEKRLSPQGLQFAAPRAENVPFGHLRRVALEPSGQKKPE